MANELPLQVIAEMLGVPFDDQARFATIRGAPDAFAKTASYDRW